MSSAIVLSCYFILVSLSYPASGQVEHGTAKIGETCERDFNCIKNAFCRSQRTCFCEPNYLPVPDSSLCVPTVGLFCNGTNAKCNLMSNAECRQDICACRETFTVDITNSSNCLARPIAEKDRCQRNDECIESLDRALCINNYCQCLTNHHYSPVTGKCVRTAGIFQSCDDDSQCYMADMGEEANALECVDGNCKCKSENTSKHCSGASSNAAKMITAIILLISVVFLI